MPIQRELGCYCITYREQDIHISICIITFAIYIGFEPVFPLKSHNIILMLWSRYLVSFPFYSSESPVKITWDGNSCLLLLVATY